ncbi:dimer_Tnp_hAT domain-containing protein [Trichonephila clavata]|uniref:Dimer_Tnp_hAT domain-containing protein n=1 Tax=Trichonephila clavata TaxID=2740835 RepID=A0A8X6LYJ7_TRICU|nr:dimer_Tnp_hAT domain-containing protein [Trichonephila clavata]
MSMDALYECYQPSVIKLKLVVLLRKKLALKLFYSFLFYKDFTVFLSSAHRWNVLNDYVRRSKEQNLKTEHIFLKLKSLCETKWSARADVLRAQIASHNEIDTTLEDLIEDNTQTPDAGVAAEGFHNTLKGFQVTLLTVIWDEILQRLDKTNEILQREELDLLCATKELQTLSLFLFEKRSNFYDYEARALQLANVPEPNYEKIRKRKFFSDEKRSPDFESVSKREILS